MVSSSPGQLIPGFRIAALGTVAIMCQSLLLREAMTTLGGSEVAWGVLLLLWLAGVGAGARLGGGAEASPGLDRWLPLAVSLAAVFGAALLRTAPVLLIDVSGEVANAPEALLLWLAAVTPPAAAVGFAFVRLAGAVGEASSAYGLECLGAAVGGIVFTFVLAPCGGGPVIAGAAVGIGVAVGVLPNARAAAIAAAGLCIAIGIAAGPWVAKATWGAGRRTQGLAASRETRHQRIEVGDGDPAAVYVDGRLQGTLPADPYKELPRIRLLGLLHPSPKHVAIVGGLSDGRIAGLLDPEVQQLLAIDEDRSKVLLLGSANVPAVAEVLADRRVVVRHSDPVRAFQNLSELDVIVLLDGPPATLRANRSRTLEFFEVCRKALSPRGLLILDSNVADDYIGGAAGRLLTIQAATLRAVFPVFTAISGNPVYLVAGRSEANLELNLASLKQRTIARSRGADDPLALLLPTLYDQHRSTLLTSNLISGDPGPLNTTTRPRAVLPAAALIEGRGFHPLLHALSAITRKLSATAAIVFVMGAAWILVSPFIGSRTRARTTPAFIIGFASMTWWLLLMAAWQGSRGAIYSEVGLLTSLFMAGMAAGSAAIHRADSRKTLPWTFVAAAAASAMIAADLAPLLPEVIIPVLLVACGAIAGAAFPGIASIAGGRRNRRGIARAFAGDELGAAVAALVVGVFGLPWIGIPGIATFTALYCLAAIPGAVRGRSSTI